MKLFCKECGDIISLYNFSNLRDCDNSRIRRYCKNCDEKEYQYLLKDRFIEEYDDCQIYKKDNLYYPYWGCSYGFEKLEDCKKRIDNKNISIIDVGMLGLFIDSLK